MIDCKTVLIVAHHHSGAEFLSKCLDSSEGISGAGTVNRLGGPANFLKSISCSPETGSLVVYRAEYSDLGVNQTHSGNDLLNWFVENQSPIIHLVRENVLDCLVDRCVEYEQELPTVENVILEISRMRKETKDARTVLSNAFCLELQYDQLIQSGGIISKQAAHLISKFLGLGKVPQGLVSSRIQPRTSAARSNLLKHQIRPELTKNGYGKMFDLPRAA